MRTFRGFLIAILFLLCGTARATVQPPYLCAPSTWDPTTHPWPAAGWCDWQPDPPEDAGNPPPFVFVCNGEPTCGQLQVFSGTNYTGKCAVIDSEGYVIDAVYSWVELNGWYTATTSPSGVITPTTWIQSFKLGPVCPGAGVQESIMWAYGPSADQTNIPRCHFVNHSTVNATHVPDLAGSCRFLGLTTPTSFWLEAE